MSPKKMRKESNNFPPNYRWNFIAILVDSSCFGIAFAFFDPNSVLPAFVREFTSSSLVVGLIGTVFNGFWLLPQLVTARLIVDKPRKKPYMILGTWGRALFWVIALALWTGLGNYPLAMLILFFSILALFAVSDSVTAVSWFDIMAKSIPMKQRGRLLGMSQLISGVAGLGVGAIVASILSSPRLPFPSNYALIFALASTIFVPAVIALRLVREPLAVTPSNKVEKSQKDGLLTPLRENPIFRRWTIARLLVGMVGLATPFFVGHAIDVLSLPASIVGSFVAAQTLAKALGGLVFGFISDRWGPRFVIRLGGIAAMGAPLFAMIVHFSGSEWLVSVYPFVYVMMGFMQSSWVLGFFNYLLEIAPEDRRPMYVGLSNTVMGVMTLVPTLGGWLLASTSYGVLFGTTVAFVLAGVLISLTLKPSEMVAMEKQLQN
ncbi:MAG: hypothetical protein DRI56_06970 [Chloroflexota bacterium]|nr:MAG: hypothetical protein DRI56_06970 [Chloroflexota bacterium]